MEDVRKAKSERYFIGATILPDAVDGALPSRLGSRARTHLEPFGQSPEGAPPYRGYPLVSVG